METEKDLHTLHTKTLGVFEGISSHVTIGGFFYVDFKNGGSMCIPDEEVVAFISQKAAENKKAVIHQDLFDFGDNPSASRKISVEDVLSPELLEKLKSFEALAASLNDMSVEGLDCEFDEDFCARLEAIEKKLDTIS